MIVDGSLCSVKLRALSTHLAMQDKTKVGSKNYIELYRLIIPVGFETSKSRLQCARGNKMAWRRSGTSCCLVRIRMPLAFNPLALSSIKVSLAKARGHTLTRTHTQTHAHSHIRLSVCLFVCLSVCHSVRLSLCLCLSVSLSLCLSVSLPLCLSVFLSVCLSVGRSVCRSVGLSVCRSVGLSLCRSVALLVCRSVGLAVWRSVGLSVCRSVGLAVWPSVGLSVCRSVGLSVCRSGCLAVWLSGCLAVWLSACLPVCLSVCLCVWFFDSLICCLFACWLFGCFFIRSVVRSFVFLGPCVCVTNPETKGQQQGGHPRPWLVTQRPKRVQARADTWPAQPDVPAKLLWSPGTNLIPLVSECQLGKAKNPARGTMNFYVNSFHLW